MEIETLIKDLIKILEKEEPKNVNIINSLQNCNGGKWKNKAYYQFVNSENPNQLGSKWQFSNNLIIEHPERGTIIIDILKDNLIGGIEFYELI
ncbi:hypothetical protein ACEN2I_19930 [Flavobacterium sp. W22_SRS_FK3]|uniref:hypothetical protein n=1 Tax=Flavobacterium sp. W22_SRS_FK3 TaxID=3240275 RepID=UPI003F93CFD4